MAMWLSAVPFLAGVAGALLAWREFGRRRELGAANTRLRTELDQAKAAHTETRSRLEHQQHALLESMIEGVLLLDSAHKVILINSALRRTFRIEHDVTGQSALSALPLHEIEELLVSSTSKGPVIGFELTTPGLNEQRFLVNATPIGSHPAAGTPAILLVFHDVTRLKQLERTRQEFVANVSHELRTPLSLIKGSVETLLDGGLENPEVNARFLRIIEKHADRLAFLIEDLLTLSSLESGQFPLSLHPIRIDALVQDVLDDLQAKASDRGVTLTLESQVGVGVEIEADADRLEQVFYNLVENAIKYGRPNGAVRVRTQPGPANTLGISVMDDGPGLPPDALPRVFERFYRADRARAREQGGTGLGLAIVKHIVQAHHGSVGVESEHGRGCNFWVRLPIRQTADFRPGSAEA